MGKQQKSAVLIDTAKCAPCTGQICIGVCPQGALEEGKNRKPQVINVVECTKCGVCVNLCPTKAISIDSINPKK
jgi:NAD-dependent dihydropyrimidine dehydrogenase PreA subunit